MTVSPTTTHTTASIRFNNRRGCRPRQSLSGAFCAMSLALLLSFTSNGSFYVRRRSNRGSFASSPLARGSEAAGPLCAEASSSAAYRTITTSCQGAPVDTAKALAEQTFTAGTRTGLASGHSQTQACCCAEGSWARLRWPRVAAVSWFAALCPAVRAAHRE